VNWKFFKEQKLLLFEWHYMFDLLDSVMRMRMRKMKMKG